MNSAYNSPIITSESKEIIGIVKDEKVKSDFGRIELIHYKGSIVLIVELVCFDKNVFLSRKRVVSDSIEPIGVEKFDDLTFKATAGGRGVCYTGILIYFLKVKTVKGLAKYLKGVFEDLY